jgi:tRNA(Arg) A34 adenosine deaminase TadA
MTARRTVVAALAAIGLQGGARGVRATSPTDADRRGHDAALRMRRLAESWGDQSYGAVIVLDGRVVGEGPSRVVRDADPDAHAERVAIRDALARLGAPTLAGAVLYSTSRACVACENAAARAGVARMVHGAALVDVGRPVDRSR